MPSINQLRTLTAEIKIPLGTQGEITIRPLIERISPKDETWARLSEIENANRSAIQAIFAEMNQLAAESGALLRPAPDRVEQLRESMSDALKGISAHIFPLPGEDADLVGAQAIAQKATKDLEAFQMELVPSSKEQDKRLKSLEAKSKVATKKLDEATKALTDARIERLIYLLDHPAGWDITEGDAADSPMLPVTRENLESVTVLVQVWPVMLEKCEAAVVDFLAPNAGGNSLPT